MKKKYLIFIVFIVSIIGTISAQERLNNKGVYLKCGISNFSKTQNRDAIAGTVQSGLGARVGFFLEKMKEGAKIGWRSDVGLRFDRLRVHFPAQPEFNLPETQASDFGLRANLTNYILYRPIRALRIGLGIDPTFRVQNFRNINFNNWGYQNFALGYVGNIAFDLNKKFTIEASYNKENILPTIYKKQGASLAAAQILLGVSYKF